MSSRSVALLVMRGAAAAGGVGGRRRRRRGARRGTLARDIHDDARRVLGGACCSLSRTQSDEAAKDTAAAVCQPASERWRGAYGSRLFTPRAGNRRDALATMTWCVRIPSLHHSQATVTTRARLGLDRRAERRARHRRDPPPRRAVRARVLRARARPRRAAPRAARGRSPVLTYMCCTRPGAVVVVLSARCVVRAVR